MVRGLFIVIFLCISIMGFGQFEGYVIGTRVGSEEFANVEVIEDVAERGVGSSLSFLLEDAGIYLQNRGVFGVQSDLTIRGSRFSQTSIAISGVVFNDIQSGHLNLSLPLTIYDVGVVGIQKSANSMIYGSDAIGGVVDFRVLEDIEENVKFRLYSGDFGLFGGVFSVSKGFGPVGFRISFDRKRSDGYMFNTDFDNWIVNTTLISKLYGFNTILFLGHLEKDFGASKFYRTEAREKEVVSVGIFKIEKDAFKFNLFYKQALDNYIVNITIPNSQVNNHLKTTLGGSVENVFSFGEFGDLFVKLEGRYNTIDSKANVGGIITNLLGERYDIPLSFIGEYGVYPVDGGAISLGVRSDFWYFGDRVYGSILSPSFKGYYYINESLKVSGNVSRFFRVPTYVELYYYDGVAFGNTNLQPEEGWNYELNLNYFLDSSKKNLVYVSGFWRDSLNVIDFADDKTIPGLRYEATNIRWISGGGIEVGFNFNTYDIFKEDGNIKLFYAYSKFDSGVPLNFTFRYDKYLEHQLNISVLQKLRGFEVYVLGSLRNRFEGKDIDGNLLPYTTYTLINAKVSYEIISGGRIFVEGYNLGNVEYEDISGVKMPGRWVWAGLEFTLM